MNAAEGDALFVLLIGAVLGLLLLYIVIYNAVLHAIRESRKPEKVKASK